MNFGMPRLRSPILVTHLSRRMRADGFAPLLEQRAADAVAAFNVEPTTTPPGSQSALSPPSNPGAGPLPTRAVDSSGER